MNRHAYLIIAHNEPRMLRALLQALDWEWNDIILHIDRRNPSLLKEAQHILLNRAQLYIIPHPIAVYWGHTSQVEVELLLMHEALNHGPHAYYHLLSGCDMPIKSAEAIRQFFNQHQGTEFVGFWNDEIHHRDALRKVRYYYFFNRWKQRSSLKFVHSLTTPLRNLLLGMQKMLGGNRLRGQKIEIKKGFQWFSITEECCRYMVNRESDIRKLFRFTLCPDEIFMQTMIWNSPFRERLFDTENVQNGSLRAIDWERGNPYVWQKSDIGELIRSPYLFARKFSSENIEAVQELTKRMCQEEPYAS